MKSIIKDILDCNHANTNTIVQNEEYWRLIRHISLLYDQLNGQLNEEQKKTLREIDMLHGLIMCESDLIHYSEGLKIGLRLGLEVSEE